MDVCRDLFIEHCQKGHAFPEDAISVLECQFSRLVGTPVAVLFNAKTVQCGEKNMRACRLSTDITTGKHTQVRIVWGVHIERSVRICGHACVCPVLM